MLKYLAGMAVACTVMVSASPASAVCGAVAMSSNGVWSASWNAQTCDEANGKAFAQCRKNGGFSGCLSQTSDGWIAGVRCENGDLTGIRLRSAPDSKTAVRLALMAAKDTFKIVECRLKVLIAADGSHLKFKNKN